MELKTINIQYFFCDTENGRNLRDLLCYPKTDKTAHTQICKLEEISDILKDKGYILNILSPLPAAGLSRKKSAPAALLNAAFSNHIVIVDGSLEPDQYNNQQRFGNNYECLTPAAMSLDNVLLVSRTQIPLNFLPARSNVKRLGDISDGEWNKGGNAWKRGYNLAYSNQEIVKWLTYELTRMADTGRLSRQEELRIDLSRPITNFKEITRKEFEVMDENTSFLRRERYDSTKSQKVCFISYRGTYWSNKYNAENGEKYSIKDLVTIIKKFHTERGENEPIIKIYPEGVLSNELMPEARRWAFVSYLDRSIRECDEFWIFDTKHKDMKLDPVNGTSSSEYGYWDSWWCQGEILTILQMKKQGRINDSFKVFRFIPDEIDEKKIELVDISNWHNLTEQESKELARYYANSDFFEAGYESVPVMRRMRYWPQFLRKWRFKITKKIMALHPMYEHFQEDSYTFEDYENSIFSHVYDKSFYEDRIYTCPICSTHGRTMDIVTDKKAARNDFVINFLNINGWYTDRENWGCPKNVPGAFIISKKVFNKLMKTIGEIGDGFIKLGGAFKHPRNNENIRHTTIIKSTDEEFYLWWTPRRGKRTGPNGVIIERINIFAQS